MPPSPTTTTENSNDSSFLTKMCSIKPEYWKPASKDIVPEAKYCPDTITHYAAKPEKSLALDVRMHLSYLGWKIDFSRQGGILRFRYTSPDDAKRSYFSLHKVCLDLRTTMCDEAVVGIQEVDKVEAIHGGGLLQQSNNTQLILDVQEVARKNPGKSSSTKESCNDFVDVEPEYCPQAIVDWYLYDSKNKDKNSDVKPAAMTLKAKKHLSYMGWVFWYAMKGDKRELRYTSPGGICYYSLKTACKGCIDEGGEGDRVGHNVASNGNLSTNIFKAGTMEFSRASGTKKRMITDDLPTPGSMSTKDENAYSPAKRRGGKENMIVFKLRDRKNVTTKSMFHVSRSSKRVRQEVIPSSSNANPRTVLSWLIENNMVLPRAKVYYRMRKDSYAILKGMITHDGINCNCCQKVFTLKGFQIRAGGSIHNKPATRIFLDDGRSLLDCQMQLMRIYEAKFSHTTMNGSWRQGENDDVCSVCHYGGELILCDSCPSSFHATCLGLEDVPGGYWFCQPCCCGICGRNRMEGDTLLPGDDNFFSCYQCDRRYHVGCLRNTDRLQNYHPASKWFCSNRCQDVSVGLQMLLGKTIPVGANNLGWTMLKCSDELDVEELTENYSKLKVAVEVMHECFEPVKDARTGKDIVDDVVFSRRSDLNRSNYRGFCTILLERNDEVISVANVRVHGQRVAEVPLVATRFHYRRHGMCRVLLNELEKQLRILGVEKLVLPAVPSVLDTWINSFGFSKMSELERRQYLDCNFLDFQDTLMCQKLLVKTPPMQSWPKLVYGNTYSYSHFDDSSPKSEVLDQEEIEKIRFADQVLLECPVVEASA